MSSTQSHKCSANLFILVNALLFSICIIIFAVMHTQLPEESSPSPGTRASDTLKFVLLVSRHGNRRSFSSLPLENVKWHCGLKELTKFGHVQAYNLGVKIRSLYNGFLSTEYRSTDISASSTSTDRTMMSGELFLAGLYPPVGYQVWNPLIPWQPIPLYSNSSDLSTVVNNICPKSAEERNKIVQAFSKEKADIVSSLFLYVKERVGLNISNIDELYSVWDVLTCADEEGFPLPDWAGPIYPHPMAEIFKECNRIFIAGTPTMVRRGIGPFFKDITSLIKKKITGSLSPDRQMYYFSGHDMSIIGLQALLGIPKESIISLVSPSSAMIFEVHENPAGRFNVEVLYLDGSTPSISLQPIVPPECGNPCDFDTLVKITQNYTNISNYEQECQI